jgi:hypothetical protein
MHFYVPRSKNAAQHVLSMPSSRKISVDSFSFPFLYQLYCQLGPADHVCVRECGELPLLRRCTKHQEEAAEPFGMRSKKASFPPDANHSTRLRLAKARTKRGERRKRKTAKFQSTYFQARFISRSLSPSTSPRSCLGARSSRILFARKAPCEKYFAFRTPMYLYVRSFIICQ